MLDYDSDEVSEWEIASLRSDTVGVLNAWKMRLIMVKSFSVPVLHRDPMIYIVLLKATSLLNPSISPPPATCSMKLSELRLGLTCPKYIIFCDVQEQEIIKPVGNESQHPGGKVLLNI